MFAIALTVIVPETNEVMGNLTGSELNDPKDQQQILLFKLTRIEH